MSVRRPEAMRRATLHEAIEQLLSEMAGGRPAGRARMKLAEEQWVPVNIFELPEGLMIVAPMPGLQPEDVELTVLENVVTLRGRRTPGQEDREYLVKEWDYGAYVRTLELPFPVDPNHIIATLDSGVLTLNLRRSQAAMPRKIEVRGAEQRSLTGGESHRSRQGLQRERSADVRE